MRSEELITVRRCQYCGKEFKAWKPSLKLCSEACKQNDAFDANFKILNALSKIRQRLSNAINTPAHQTPFAAPARLVKTHSRNIRCICKALKAKIKANRERTRKP